jgi:hypothetical protein
LVFTQPGILDDKIPAERRLGMEAGFAWIAVADKTVVYTDRGIWDGMLEGVRVPKNLNKPVEYRTLLKSNSKEEPS